MMYKEAKEEDDLELALQLKKSIAKVQKQIQQEEEQQEEEQRQKVQHVDPFDSESSEQDSRRVTQELNVEQQQQQQEQEQEDDEVENLFLEEGEDPFADVSEDSDSDPFA